MVHWFDRTPRDVIAPLLKARRPVADGDRVLLRDLRPDVDRYLGHAAALQLAVLQLAGTLVQQAPTLESKANLVRVVEGISARYDALVDLMRADGRDPIALMRPFAESSERYARQIGGNDWYDLLLSLHVTTGLLSDFFVAYGGGLPDDVRQPALRAISVDDGHPVLVAELRHAIDENPRLASRLAMWGRRLVGDALLQMYLAVHGSADTGPVGPSEPRLEPAFTDIVAAHTRRMDDLGLTA